MSKKSSITEYDLLYFTNGSIYKKKETQEIMDINNKDDIKFYKKRIIHLTKQLLKKETKTTSEIEALFENYIKEVIEHFKFTDKKELMQKEYENLKEKKKTINKDFKMMENDQLMMKDIKEKTKTISDFAIHKNKKQFIYDPPKIKKYNLKSDDMKKKGLNNN
jgi:hypothetical protein